MALAGFGKTFGPGLPEIGVAFLDVAVSGVGPLREAKPVMFQLVGQNLPLPTPTAKPEVQRTMPESCQPPMNPLTHLLTCPPTALPWPNGSSAMKLLLT